VGSAYRCLLQAEAGGRLSLSSSFSLSQCMELARRMKCLRFFSAANCRMEGMLCCHRGMRFPACSPPAVTVQRYGTAGQGRGRHGSGAAPVRIAYASIPPRRRAAVSEEEWRQRTLVVRNPAPCRRPRAQGAVPRHVCGSPGSVPTR